MTHIYLSAAVTADGALDDCTDNRLLISDAEDWAEVARLRANYDAILVGAQTVRKDNPRLIITDESLRMQRIEQGMTPDLAKVTVTGSGELDPSSRFFTCGTGRKIVFATHPLPHLDLVAEVIVMDHISAARIVTELEKRGLCRLFVEGGAQMLEMFLAEGMADTLRLAVNPTLHILDPHAPRFNPDISRYSCAVRLVGSMQVTTCTLRQPNDADVHYLSMAVAEGLRCTPSTSSYCVGAVVLTADKHIFTGYTHETSATHHAEQEAVAKALAAGEILRGATMYTSMEPCTTRSSEPESCTAMLLRLGFSRVVFALYEPDCFVTCRGALTLRENRVEVRVLPELAAQARRANKHLKQ